MEKLYSTKLNENNQIREKYLLDVSYDKSSKALQNKFWLDYKDFTYKGNILKVNFIEKINEIRDDDMINFTIEI